MNHRRSLIRILTSVITIALFPKVYEWIEMSLYELGKYIGTKIQGHYRLEGASREKTIYCDPSRR